MLKIQAKNLAKIVPNKMKNLPKKIQSKTRGTLLKSLNVRINDVLKSYESGLFLLLDKNS